MFNFSPFSTSTRLGPRSSIKILDANFPLTNERKDILHGVQKKEDPTMRLCHVYSYPIAVVLLLSISLKCRIFILLLLFLFLISRTTAPFAIILEPEDGRSATKYILFHIYLSRFFYSAGGCSWKLISPKIYTFASYIFIHLLPVAHVKRLSPLI
jgi:hypothetical protein